MLVIVCIATDEQRIYNLGRDVLCRYDLLYLSQRIGEFIEAPNPKFNCIHIMQNPGLSAGKCSSKSWFLKGCAAISIILVTLTSKTGNIHMGSVTTGVSLSVTRTFHNGISWIPVDQVSFYPVES